MANVMFKKGLLSALPTSHAEGTLYVTTDERAIYLDIDDSTRIRLGDFQEFASLEALNANVNPSTTALYYIDDINCLAKWDGTQYVQINLDTGMTSVEVVGAGNAVTSATYDATTRKLTLTKGEAFATRAYVGEIPSGYTETTLIAYVNKKAEETLNAASGGSSESAASVLAALNTYKSENDPKVQANSDAIEGLQGDLADEVTRATTAEEANAAAAAAALAEAQAKVTSVGAGNGSMAVGGTSTAPTVAVKLSQDADNAIELAEDGLKVTIPAATEYSIVKAENSGNFAAVYNLTKGGTIVGASINIPKDMVVESGSVVENPDGQPAGTYIKMVLQNVAEPLYIDVGSLIEYVTSGSQSGDMIVINVSDNHKVTATITDGSITLGKLHTDVQTAIGKAHSHENASVLDGINADKVTDWDSAATKAHEHANKTELDKIAEGDKAKWDAAQANAEATAAAALTDAKSELSGNITDETTRATAAEAKALSDAKEYTDQQISANALAWGSF